MAPNRKTMGQQTRLRLNRGFWAVIMMAVPLSAQLLAQAAQSSPGEKAPAEEKAPLELRRALDQLTSPAREDWGKSEVELRKLMKQGDIFPLAACGLALFYTKVNKVEAIEKFCVNAPSFPSADQDLRAFVLRLQLWLDLVQEDRLEATKHFSELADLALSKELSQASRESISALLGSVMGLLESKTAISPIEPEVLATVQKKLLDRKESEFVMNLKPRYRNARLHAESAEKWFLRNADVTPNELKTIALQDLKESQSQLTKALKDYSDRCHEKEELVFERRKTFQLIEPLKNQIAAVELQWRQNPQIHNPIAPNRNAISVQTTYERKTGRTKEVRKTRWVTDNNGKRKEETYYETKDVYETVRRDQRDIDRDIDAIYLPRLNYYQALVRFRNDMQQQRRDLDQKANDVHAEIAKIDALIDSKEKEIHTARQERKELNFEKRVLDACNKSLELGAPKFAFRPLVYEVLDFVAEKNVILESHRLAAQNKVRAVR